MRRKSNAPKRPSKRTVYTLSGEVAPLRRAVTTSRPFEVVQSMIVTQKVYTLSRPKPRKAVARVASEIVQRTIVVTRGEPYKILHER